MRDQTSNLRSKAETLRHRLLCLSWWRGIMVRYPGGIVPVCTAARILGVSRQRVRQLIDVHRLPLIDDMPGGNPADVFIPIDALLGAPMAIDTGRPMSLDPSNDNAMVRHFRTNPWADVTGEPQSLEKYGLQPKKSYLPAAPSLNHCRTEP